MYKINHISKISIGLFLGVFLCFATPGLATTTYTYFFGNGTSYNPAGPFPGDVGDVPNPSTFKDLETSTVPLVTTGYLSNGTTDTFLYQKNDANYEYGLGLQSTSDHNIHPGNFMQINMTQLSAQSLLTLEISVGTQSNDESGDTWDLYGTNTAGTLVGATLLVNTSNVNFPNLVDLTSFLPLGFTYLDLTAVTGNVLLSEIVATSGATPIPEPSTYLMLGSCLIFTGLARRKMKSAKL